ncbi:hypothetical protein PR048_005403 [Dryococelus australis]|uniref:Reverse transcriptase RNase H-like domain-containing protein n=1 Tax=Dryococelus australis TaxID=614101 RepID=A0ABQ9I8N4_9NEOP|nr:hypothetical protein PR048_005403 [Dryococelus australis]
MTKGKISPLILQIELNTTEINYTVTEKELLSIIFACLKFCTYIYGRDTTVMIDHKALCHLNTCKLLHGRITWWIIALQDYNLSIEHISGKAKVVAHSLSRGRDDIQAALAREFHVLSLREQMKQEHVSNSSQGNRVVFNTCTSEGTKREVKRILGRVLATEPFKIVCVDLFGHLPKG